MTDLTGQCMCGAVTVRATPRRSSIVACHCDMCRRWTSSMLMSVQVEPDFETEGPVRRFASSDMAERAFCETCGSALWYRITAPGRTMGQTQMAAGLFDNAGGGELSVELFIDRKPEGYALAGEHRVLTEAEFAAARAPKPEAGG